MLPSAFSVNEPTSFLTRTDNPSLSLKLPLRTGRACEDYYDLSHLTLSYPLLPRDMLPNLAAKRNFIVKTKKEIEIDTTVHCSLVLAFQKIDAFIKIYSSFRHWAQKRKFCTPRIMHHLPRKTMQREITGLETR